MTPEDQDAKKRNVRRFGGTISIIAGIVFFASAMTFFLLPAEQLEFAATSKFFNSVFANPTVLEFTFWGSMIGAVLAIGVVIIVENHIHHVNELLVRWSSILAIIAYAVSAVRNATDFIQIPALATRYVQGDSLTRTSIEAVGLVAIDPNSMLQLLLLGIWFLAVNFLGLRSGVLPRALACVGLIFGIGSLLALPFFLLNLQFASLVVMALGLVVIDPLWFIWMGTVLRRNAN
jgi:hypothetical protein